MIDATLLRSINGVYGHKITNPSPLPATCMIHMLRLKRLVHREALPSLPYQTSNTHNTVPKTSHPPLQHLLNSPKTRPHIRPRLDESRQLRPKTLPLLLLLSLDHTLLPPNHPPRLLALQRREGRRGIQALPVEVEVETRETG